MGLEIIRQIRLYHDKSQLETLEIEDDILSILEYWSDRKVIIVDSIRYRDSVPGEIQLFTGLENILLNQELLTSSHSINLFEAIELGRILQKIPREMTLIGVAGKQYDMGEKMSEEVESSIPAIVKTISGEIP